MKDIRKEALDTCMELTDLCLCRCLAERNLLESTVMAIVNPFETMDWPEKKKRAEELIYILKTCKTDAEVMEKSGIRKKKLITKEIYDYLTTIPRGRVVTYGMIAEYLGNKHYARVVGNILHENPDGVKYPCYKVVNAQGKLSESYAFGGMKRQQELLEADGIVVQNGKVDLAKYIWNKE